MGTEDDWGNNTIHGNGNGDTIYDLYNNSTCDLSAVGNDWGTIHEEEIEAHIVHQLDDASLGLVTFIPYIGYDSVEDIPVDADELDLSKATVYTITGQRVSLDSLKPGIYIAVTKQGTKKFIIQ